MNMVMKWPTADSWGGAQATQGLQQRERWVRAGAKEWEGALAHSRCLPKPRPLATGQCWQPSPLTPLLTTRAAVGVETLRGEGRPVRAAEQTGVGRALREASRR